jgi:hypothetical protein
MKINLLPSFPITDTEFPNSAGSGTVSLVPKVSFEWQPKNKSKRIEKTANSAGGCDYGTRQHLQDERQDARSRRRSHLKMANEDVAAYEKKLASVFNHYKRASDLENPLSCRKIVSLLRFPGADYNKKQRARSSVG